MKIQEAAKRIGRPVHVIRRWIKEGILEEVWVGGHKDDHGNYVQKRLDITEDAIKLLVKPTSSAEIEPEPVAKVEDPPTEEQDTSAGRTGGGSAPRTRSSSPCSQDSGRRRKGAAGLDDKNNADTSNSVPPMDDDWISSLKKGRAKAATGDEIPGAEEEDRGLRQQDPNSGILAAGQFDLWYNAVTDVLDWDRPIIEKKYALRLACQLGGTSLIKYGVKLESLTIPLFVVVFLALVGPAGFRANRDIWRPPVGKNIPTAGTDPRATN